MLDFITPAQALSLAVVAIITATVTAWIRLRRDIREGRKSDLDLFTAMKEAAAEQMAELRAEVAELRERVAVAEQQASRAEREAALAHRKLMAALGHLSYLEESLRHAGLPIPPRPPIIAAGESESG